LLSTERKHIRITLVCLSILKLDLEDKMDSKDSFSFSPFQNLAKFINMSKLKFCFSIEIKQNRKKKEHEDGSGVIGYEIKTDSIKHP